MDSWTTSDSRQRIQEIRHEFMASGSLLSRIRPRQT